MKARVKSVADAEFAILQLLWERGPLSKRRIAERLYSKGEDSGRATVQKLLERLESKGLVKIDRKVSPHSIRASQSRQEFASHQLESLADKLSGGSLAPLVMRLIEKRRLKKSEIAELMRILTQRKR